VSKLLLLVTTSLRYCLRFLFAKIFITHAVFMEMTMETTTLYSFLLESLLKSEFGFLVYMHRRSQEGEKLERLRFIDFCFCLSDWIFCTHGFYWFLVRSCLIFSRVEPTCSPCPG
jgi:hypothetical protein